MTIRAAVVRAAAMQATLMAFAATAAVAAPSGGTGAGSAPAVPSAPDLGEIAAAASDPSQLSAALKIFLLLTALAVLPTVLLMMTSFVRMVIVFHFARQALGTQSTPPNQVLIGLALFLTMFVMYPTGARAWEDAVVPYQEGRIDTMTAVRAASDAPREWMIRNTREKELMLFVSLANLERPETPADIPMHAVVPAFVLSELRVAFQIGFLIFLPFLVIDMVVAAVLLSTGMMMLPPIVVSFPFKILLFVLVDGWTLLVSSLVRSFQA